MLDGCLWSIILLFSCITTLSVCEAFILCNKFCLDLLFCADSLLTTHYSPPPSQIASVVREGCGPQPSLAELNITFGDKPQRADHELWYWNIRKNKIVVSTKIILLLININSNFKFNFLSLLLRWKFHH